MGRQRIRGRSPASGERRAANRRRRTERAEQELGRIARQQAWLAKQLEDAEPVEPEVKWSSGAWSKVIDAQPKPTPPAPPPPPPARRPTMTMAEAAWQVLTAGVSEQQMAPRVGCTPEQLRVYIDLYVQRNA